MIFNVGDKVLISLNPSEQIHSIQDVWEYNGIVATVALRKTVVTGKLGAVRGTYYQLDGVNSKMGLPFSFLEEQLLPVYE